MIREFLESNGFKIQGFASSYTHILEVPIGLDFVCVYSHYGSDTDQAIEQACIQYIKEYGVKLDWLCQDVDGLYMDKILDNEWIEDATFEPATQLEAWLEYHYARILPESRKLVMLFIAHDIKII